MEFFPYIPTDLPYPQKLWLYLTHLNIFKRTFIYLKGRETRRESSGFTLQMPSRVRPGQSQEPETSSGSSTRVTGTQVLGPPATIFQGQKKEAGLEAE